VALFYRPIIRTVWCHTLAAACFQTSVSQAAFASNVFSSAHHSRGLWPQQSVFELRAHHQLAFHACMYQSILFVRSLHYRQLLCSRMMWLIGVGPPLAGLVFSGGCIRIECLPAFWCCAFLCHCFFPVKEETIQGRWLKSRTPEPLLDEGGPKSPSLSGSIDETFVTLPGSDANLLIGCSPLHQQLPGKGGLKARCRPSSAEVISLLCQLIQYLLNGGGLKSPTLSSYLRKVRVGDAYSSRQTLITLWL
jgi:hypothetical protein